MIAQCATFSKSLNPRIFEKSVSDIRIRFPFESSFWISVVITILPHIQSANWMWWSLMCSLHSFGESAVQLELSLFGENWGFQARERNCSITKQLPKRQGQGRRNNGRTGEAVKELRAIKSCKKQKNRYHLCLFLRSNDNVDFKNNSRN